MIFRTVISACAFVLLPAIVLADPTGSYKVAGTSEDGSEYQGTVKVLRNGETYIVDWMIGKNESIGTGLGAKFSGDRFEMGPASDEDTAISVGYVSKENFGIAMYFEQADGSWQGVWTYGGSEKVSSEIWTRE
ncbi:hypothetical protein HFO93_17030 [Rhizobium leguminosarum]|uniref:hypothetical protein n=1 Tax=Rhizobium TaxID=379 RepID=UPI001C973B51|nr:hypothetical protein [Rhizobium leguminosarum]MBY5445152.1 hypothetical protein [Rhizobium leguminosarum]